MHLDLFQTLVAATVIVAIYFIWRHRNHEYFEDKNEKYSNVIPQELPVKEAATSLFKNINFEIKNYLNPTVNVIKRFATLRPKVQLDKTLINIQKSIRDINSSKDDAATKMINVADALPTNVDIYKNTYINLIKLANREYEFVYANAKSASISGFVDMGENPSKTINSYNRVSATRIRTLEENESEFTKLKDDFEAAFARLRILLEQSK